MIESSRLINFALPCFFADLPLKLMASDTYYRGRPVSGCYAFFGITFEPEVGAAKEPPSFASLCSIYLLSKSKIELRSLSSPLELANTLVGTGTLYDYAEKLLLIESGCESFIVGKGFCIPTPRFNFANSSAARLGYLREFTPMFD